MTRIALMMAIRRASIRVDKLVGLRQAKDIVDTLCFDDDAIFDWDIDTDKISLKAETA